jgi:hypothetical protein
LGRKSFIGSCLLFIVIIVGILGWTYKHVTTNSVINSPQQMEPDFYSKTDSHGAVTVIAKWLNSGLNEDELKFNIIMSTHSVNLDPYDVANSAEVYIDSNLVQSLMKIEKEGGGHHIVQNLTVPISQSSTDIKKAKSVKLVLKNLDNIPRREFIWTLSK